VPRSRQTDISRSGTLTGITDINQGVGLDIQLYGSLRYRFDWQQPQHETFSFRASGNAFYKITPQTDRHADGESGFLRQSAGSAPGEHDAIQSVPAGDAQFLLQDAATFEYGGRGFSASFDYNYPAENGSPFFSRNIGLAGGIPVSLIGGTKLSGEFAGFGVGALSVVTSGTGDTKRSQVLSVARVTRPIGESKLGFVFTNGDPTGRSENTLAGLDFQYRDSNFRPGKILQSDFYYVRSFSDSKGEDDSFGAALTLPNEPWGIETRFKQLGTNYFPALGFVNRTGIRQYDGIAQYRRRDLGWRWLDLATSWYFVTDLSNHLESRRERNLDGDIAALDG